MSSFIEHSLLLFLIYAHLWHFADASSSSTSFSSSPNGEGRNRLIYYDLSRLFDAQLRASVSTAISLIQNNTCIRLHEHQPEEPPSLQTSPTTNVNNKNTTTITTTTNLVTLQFEQSEQRSCGVDADFSGIVYLSRECIEKDPNACLLLIAKSLTWKKALPTTVFPMLNEYFECDDRCQLVCSNGGTLDAEDSGDDCAACNCPFNGLFTGQTCEELIKLGDYTDEVCKTINVGDDDSDGIIKFSAPLDENTYCQIKLVADDPWARLQIEFVSLEMSRRSAGAVDCPDRFYVYGLEVAPIRSIKCNSADAPRPGERFISASNFLLFQLEANRFDRSARHGPVIRYSLRHSPYSKDIHKKRAPSAIAPSETDDGMHISEGSSHDSSSFLGDLNGSALGIAILLACASAAIVLAILAALGRRRRIIRNRRYHHHHQNGTGNGSVKRRNSASSAKSANAVVGAGVEAPPEGMTVTTTTTEAAAV